MRNRTLKAAMAGAIAAVFAFTAVTAQIFLASSANAHASYEKAVGNNTYWFRNQTDHNGAPCKVNVWGHALDC